MVVAAGLVLLVAGAVGLQTDGGWLAVRIALWSLVCGLVGYLFYNEAVDAFVLLGAFIIVGGNLYGVTKEAKS